MKSTRTARAALSLASAMALAIFVLHTTLRARDGGIAGGPPAFSGSFTSTPNLLYSDVAVSGTTIFDGGSPQPGISDGAGEGAFAYAGSSLEQVGNEVAYKILHAGGKLSLSLTGQATNLDLMLLGATGTPAATIQRCETGGAASEDLLAPAAASGTYYAVVDTRGAGNAGSTYTLIYEAAPVGLNLDANVASGAGSGAPGASFGGAADQPGTWTAITNAAANANLVTLDGFTTAMTVSRIGGSGIYAFNNANTTGDHQLLLDDLYDTLMPVSYVFAHLPKGHYTVFTYAIAPDDATFRTNISVSSTTSLNPQTIGGPMPANDFASGITHAVHDVVIAPGANLLISGSVAFTAGSINGIQIVPLPVCPADVNGDEMVDVNDLLALIGAWGPCGAPPCAADINDDNAVDVNDLLALIGAWGACP